MNWIIVISINIYTGMIIEHTLGKIHHQAGFWKLEDFMEQIGN